MVKEHRDYHGKYFLTLVFVSVLLVVLSTSTNEVFAMGDAASTCPNMYSGSITSFIINNGTQTFDAIANPGVVFNVNINNNYNVTFVIHTPTVSLNNNSNPGTTWYSDNAPSYYNGHCVPADKSTTIGPNQDVTIGRSFTSGCSGCWGTQAVNFATYTSSSVNYNVQWMNFPDKPTNLVATTVSSSQINLSWTAPPNFGGANVTGYKIERSTDGGATWSTIQSNTGSTSTTYSDTWLTSGTTYTYRVSAINNTGTGSPSNTASATTFNTVPTPPTGLTATAQILQINLSWNAPSDNGGTPITGYMIERSTDNGSTWSTLVPNTGSTGTTYSDTNVQPLTTYTYRISAINDIGTGNPSNTASASITGTPTLP